MARIHEHMVPHISEFVGTFIFCLIGLGANAQLAVTNSADNAATNLLRALAWGLGLAVAIFVTKNASGGQVNPAISITEATFRGLPPGRFFGHMIFQLLGAFAAACFVWFNYGSMFGRIITLPDGGLDAGARIFATYPVEKVGFWHGALTETIGTFVLALGTHAITDVNYSPQIEAISPLAIGLLFSAIGLSVGYPTGYALNPARDFGPRIFSAFLYGGRVFTTHHWYWLVPLVAPFFGAVIGAGVYHWVVKADVRHHQLEGDENA
ncbi:hypothetical protein EV182_002691 [Spiromyces aspiralis]|uniref:Uncharacterized protein n=1 Tax=Spiromyces aspiralis TaxID=68401 RepID=A0ACC1HHC3_9FUNG|nr:hypothetical protein EV182_002691 [Spiromyces aspiralis]